MLIKSFAGFLTAKIWPPSAESIVDLDIDWSHITTLSDLQMGLLVAFKNLDIQLSS